MLLAQAALDLNGILKFLHVLTAILACGGLAAATVMASGVGRGSAAGLSKALQLAEYSLYALFVFGVIMGFTLKGANNKMLIAAPWLSISMLLWIIMIAILHAMVRKPVRLAATSSASTGDGVRGESTGLASKARTGLMIMNVLWVITLVLMVFRLPA